MTKIDPKDWRQGDFVCHACAHEIWGSSPPPTGGAGPGSTCKNTDTKVFNVLLDKEPPYNLCQHHINKLDCPFTIQPTTEEDQCSTT